MHNVKISNMQWEICKYAICKWAIANYGNEKNNGIEEYL
jgi:hypothetical protein